MIGEFWYLFIFARIVLYFSSFLVSIPCCFLFIGKYCGKLYTVHHTLYTVHCTLYPTLNNAHCTLYTVHCTLYNVHCTLYLVDLTLNTVQCELYTKHPTALQCTVNTHKWYVYNNISFRKESKSTIKQFLKYNFWLVRIFRSVLSVFTNSALWAEVV